MATKSFTRTIVISESKAIDKLSRTNKSRIDKILSNNKEIITKKIKPSTVTSILNNF